MKILLNHFKFWLFLNVFVLLDFVIESDYSAEGKRIYLVICTALTLIVLISYLLKKISSKGLFVDDQGFIWKTNNGIFKYPWDSLKFRVLINIPNFKVIEISSNQNPKYRLLISWLVETKGLKAIEQNCPMDHKLYDFVTERTK